MLDKRGNKCHVTIVSWYQRLQTQLCSSPVSSFGVVSDSVTSSQSDPLRQWSVLFLGFSQSLFDLERFLSLWKNWCVFEKMAITNCKNIVTS